MTITPTEEEIVVSQVRTLKKYANYTARWAAAKTVPWTIVAIYAANLLYYYTEIWMGWR